MTENPDCLADVQINLRSSAGSGVQKASEASAASRNPRNKQSPGVLHIILYLKSQGPLKVGRLHPTMKVYVFLLVGTFKDGIAHMNLSYALHPEGDEGVYRRTKSL